MSDDAINNIIKKYVRENLSPTEDEQSYVSDKYDTLKEILGQSCFRAGSFARYTAVRPLHDLDVIWITDNPAVMDDPETVLRQLANQLRSEYEKRGGANRRLRRRLTQSPFSLRIQRMRVVFLSTSSRQFIALIRH